MFKISLQFFAEEETAAVAKTFSEDYVKTIREEAKDNRLARKAAEDKATATEVKFKKLIGLKDTDTLDDDKITAYQTAQTQQAAIAAQKANDKLLLAEIKNLDGYDSKLVQRLMDKSKVTIDADGNITGLQEAVEALAIEFPQIKKAPATTGVNPLLPVGKDAELKAAYDEAIKRNDFVGANSIMYQIRQTKK